MKVGQNKVRFDTERLEDVAEAARSTMGHREDAQTE